MSRPECRGYILPLWNADIAITRLLLLADVAVAPASSWMPGGSCSAKRERCGKAASNIYAEAAGHTGTYIQR